MKHIKFFYGLDDYGLQFMKILWVQTVRTIFQKGFISTFIYVLGTWSGAPFALIAASGQFGMETISLWHC